MNDLRKQLTQAIVKETGLIVKYQHFVVGSKDKPRFPIFGGFRDRRDM